MSFVKPPLLAGIAVFASNLCLHADPTSSNGNMLEDLIVSSSALKEETEDGVYGEPEWVGHRRFSTTRIYIQKDPGEIGVETWYRTRFYDGDRVTHRIQQEVEIGLPYRMQLDLYEKVFRDSTDPEGWVQDEFAVELRYAFADWGKIWGNPTLYEEYAFTDGGSDVLESKLLFGDDYKGWHWGVNFINEHVLDSENDNEWGVALGLSRTVIDSKLSVGLEGKWTHPEGDRDEFILGPSIQWLPTANTHLDLVVMAGLNNASPDAECWLIFGFDFGDGEKSKGYKPTTVGGGL